MFENYLTEDEKKILLKTLAFLSSVDGVKQEEIDFINYVAQGLNIDDKDIIDNIKGIELKEILAEITNDKSKNIILVELINLGYSDRDYSANEKAGIRTIAKYIGVGEKKIAELENWINDGFKWQQKWSNQGLKLIEN